MSAALAEYITALHSRNAQDRAQEDLITAYTKLADAYADSQQPSAAPAPLPEPPKDARAPTPSRIPPSITGSRAPTPQRTASDSPPQLRADLTAANKTIHELNLAAAAFKDEVATLKAREAAAEKTTAQLQARIAKLEAERVGANRRLRDKEGELKEKSRMVGAVQDEMLGMEMQMNVAEGRAQKLEGENRELVERWMRKVGGEAEEMNEGSGWK